MPDSDSTNDNLPLEITEVILCRLPAKSVGRFKSVSKTWDSLISHPKFIKTHLRHQKTKKMILRSTRRCVYSLVINSDKVSAAAKELHFPSHPEVMWRDIWGCCNGLVLVFARDGKATMFMMNPTTKELWKVPLNRLPLSLDICIMHGFGYVPSTDDYKIVSILVEMFDESCSNMSVWVYSLRANLWKKLPDARYDHFEGLITAGALVNHNLHWLTSTRSPNYSSTIIAFSLENEEFSEVELPDTIENVKAMTYLPFVFRGKLALFGRKTGNDLWVMEDYGVGTSWSKLCCIHGVDGYFVKPVCLVEGSDRDIVLGDEDEDRVLVYNVDERRCRNVRTDGLSSGFIIEGIYVESLESPAKYRTTQ